MHTHRWLGIVPSVVLLLVPVLAAAQPPAGQGAPPPQAPPQQAPPPGYGAPPPQQGPPPGYGAPPPQQAAYPQTTVVEEEPRPAPNSVFAEGLGAGLYWSINYERLVIDDLGVRLGFSYVSLSASATSSDGTTSSASSTYLGFPITASYIGLRSGSHALELGGGATLAFTSASASSFASASAEGLSVFGTAMIGYRIHPVGHAGFMFRVGAMAVIGQGLSLSNPDPEAIGVLPWFYISAGASF